MLREQYGIESWLATCWTEKTDGRKYHAVLLVYTDRGVHVLDNRSRIVFNHKDWDYKWDKVETEGGIWRKGIDLSEQVSAPRAYLEMKLREASKRLNG